MSKKCPECGEIYPDDVNFCEECGPVEWIENSEQVTNNELPITIFLLYELHELTIIHPNPP